MEKVKETIVSLAGEYNREEFFKGDPIIFPKHFARLLNGKEGIFEEPETLTIKDSVTLADVEIAAIVAAHLAWGRRDMIIRDCKRAMSEMKWRPLEYVMSGKYKNDNTSLHRTIKWSEFARICDNLREFYLKNNSLEILSAERIRVDIFSQKSNPKAANKKIHMFRRWMVRNDGIVDLGLWKNTSPASLIIPLDVHVHRSAKNLGITTRNSADLTTAEEITGFLRTIFPEDPCMGDFALFAYAATERERAERKTHKNI